MKKLIATGVSLVFMASMCFSCQPKTQVDNEKLTVTTMSWPVVQWTEKILEGTPYVCDSLGASGVDLHSFQPSAETITKIANSDVFIHVGGVSDTWTEDVIKQAKDKNSDLVVINMMEVLGDSVKAEELVEGMEAHEHNHEHDEDCEDEHEHDEDCEDEHEHEHGNDEHIWLSLKNATKICEEMCDKFSEVKDGFSTTYENNTNAYVEELEKLDSEYQEVIDSAENNTLIFGDRFPFRYLMDDYEIEYYAAFIGCSADSEASFETITFLANKVDELDVPVVLAIDGSDQKIAKTIISSTSDKDQTIKVLDSMQSSDRPKDATYYSVMESNLDVIKEALE